MSAAEAGSGPSSNGGSSKPGSQSSLNGKSSIAWVVLLVLLFGAAATALAMMDREAARPFILGMLALLAVVGVFTLFALAIGLLRFGASSHKMGFDVALAEHLPEGILVTDRAGQILFANAAYRGMTGARNQDEAQTVERLFALEHGASEQIYRLSQAAAEGRPHQEDIRLTHSPLEAEALQSAGGRESQNVVDTNIGPPSLWYRVRLQALQGDAANVSFSPTDRVSVWHVTDITRDRQRQENAFLELQNAVDYLDHAPIGFFSADADGRIRYVNASLAAWLGRDLGDFENGALRLTDIVSGEGAALMANLAPRPGAVRTESVDLDLQTRTGRRLPVRVVHKVAFAPDGIPAPSRSVVMDRSILMEAGQDALRDIELRFARFFNDAPFAIATVDAQGRVLRTNPRYASVFGDLPRADGDDGDFIQSIADETGAALLSELVRSAVAGSASVDAVEVQLAGADPSDKNAEIRTARLFASPVGQRIDEPVPSASDDDSAGADSKASGAFEETGEAAIVYALDITEEKALEQKFAQSQKMQAVGQLAGGIAHDFNNVLTAIIGFSDLLLANHRTTDPSFNDIMAIKQNATRAAGLVRQLLAFSRRQTLRPQVIELNDVLGDLSILLARLIGANVKLDVEPGRALWPIKADLTQLEQVIINLAVNARDAMATSDGRLMIRTRNVDKADVPGFGKKAMPVADYVLIEVEDTGHGIPEAILEKIFDPFFSTKDVGKGTGLGLSTVYGIIKQTGGFVFCESEEKVGTTFRIFLPRHEPTQDDKAIKKIKVRHEAKDLTGQGAILVVEDEDNVRTFVARALTSRGYSVVEAATGLEALDIFDQGEPVDLVVSDVRMPEMDGPTLLTELRKRNPEIKVILVSGYADDAFRKNLDPAQNFHFLSKPFNLKELAEKVKDVLEAA
jgi:two-component system cell cycle sensor histidine kinase/response regulator CckA